MAALMLTALVAGAGCTGAKAFNPLSKGFDPLSHGPHLGSFLGVSFGDLSPDVSARFPKAVPETSPFGAETLRLSNVRSDGVVYKTVLFEFLWHGGGMQLVMAKFDPVYAAPALGDLTRRIGPPTLSKETSPGSTPDKQWRLPDGTSISFNASLGRLVIVGPAGKILSDDIKMREEKGEEFAS
jgi:hypothetical protein